ncbi:MAG: PIN domain-containing protein [Chthoniobacterales bacterium]|nr:PIN domain-containing protein [Chthoniobacterales bacterium]
MIDTSIWIDHLHRSDKQLRALLELGAVCTHPVVIGELACGAIRNRDYFLTQLLRLTSIREESAGTTLRLIEAKRLWGRGLGWSDIRILASCLSAGAQLWTRDTSLRRAATLLKISPPARGRA